MRWIRRGLLVVIVLVVLLVVVVYGGSEFIIRRSHAVPMAQLAIPHDAASVAEGARLAKIAACRDCHGREGEGKVLFADPMLGRVAPPPLAQAAAGMSDAKSAVLARMTKSSYAWRGRCSRCGWATAASTASRPAARVPCIRSPWGR